MFLMLGLGCRKLAVCCIKHPQRVVISYRSIVMNSKDLICIHKWRHSVHTKDIVGIQWEVFNVKLPPQCSCFICHRRKCSTHQINDLLRLEIL